MRNYEFCKDAVEAQQMYARFCRAAGYDMENVDPFEWLNKDADKALQLSIGDLIQEDGTFFVVTGYSCPKSDPMRGCYCRVETRTAKGTPGLVNINDRLEFPPSPDAKGLYKVQIPTKLLDAFVSVKFGDRCPLKNPSCLG